MNGRDMFYVPDKDPEFVYYWGNRADRNMIEMIGEGWELVRGAPELPPEVTAALQGITGQSGPTAEAGQSPGEIRTRGDLVLLRMKKDRYDIVVERPIREKKARHNASLDTLVERANDLARAGLARANQTNIRPRHVFTSTDNEKFDDQGVKG